jgi:glycerophosphoryl diester phosphodiesterase
VHGHRGARARRPENTIEAFCYAIELGVDFVELDVVLTKEGVPVVSHDPIKGDPPEYVPTLDAVFDLAVGNTVKFNVEAKPAADPEGLTRLIVELIRAHGIERRVMFQSFDPRMPREMKRLEPSIPRGALFEVDRDWPEVAREFEATLICPLYRLVTKDRVAWAHAMGLGVIPWTVNKPADWARLIDEGVDGIITDDPAALIAYFLSGSAKT